ncbi:MAG TPA: 2,3-bisphosphoglycerate-independent phosphoglycerate mutase [Armatimonadota bacterium]|nr:2,3-bisphosphoglycerate-independent phosphoglycerate mutase [Armatimonadota bacterium]
MTHALRKSAYAGPRGPVVLVVMDGIGVGQYEDGDAVRSALTPTLDWLKTHALSSQLRAHGTAVGLPSDEDMGNSEVGHNAIGCGRVFAQGAKLVNAAIASGALFRGEVWQSLVQPCAANGATLHFIGLFSDGNVHSHLDHLTAMLRQAKAEGVTTARVHILLDGRDVPPRSALDYVDPFETALAELNAGGVDYRIASGGGRMCITMDRYNADWTMVQRGWDTHVHGQGRQFASAREAIETYRRERPEVVDQDMPAFVIAENGTPVGPITDGDSVIFFNFRGDRAIEITRAFEDDGLTEIDRGARPDVRYAGMMQYDGDLQLPARFLVNPPAIDRTMGELLAAAGVRQMAISETQKYGHVTYFFNGNRSGKFDDALEDYVEIPSDVLPFAQRPWMKGAEITDRVIEAITSGAYRFIRLNYPNGDMVGHTGSYPATQIGVETVDLCLGRLLPAIIEAGGILVVSADHGNADDMYEHDKRGAVVTDAQTGQRKAKFAHSLNPVPVYIYDPDGAARLSLAPEAGLGISSLAATCLRLLGFVPPEDYDPSVVVVGAAEASAV